MSLSFLVKLWENIPSAAESKRKHFAGVWARSAKVRVGGSLEAH